MNDRIYLDHAATTPLRAEVLDAMLPWMGLAADAGYGNSSTLYGEGRRARQALEQARGTIAQAINASPTEIVFTSGGTESNNSLIHGLATAIRQKRGLEKGGNTLVASSFEHHAVLEPLQHMRQSGWKTVLVDPTRQGFVSAEALGERLERVVPSEDAPPCTLVSIMTVNNEIGTIQPVRELADVAHRYGALFHTDAVQALGKIPFDVAQLGIDAASFSAHKIGGPKGSGAFYLRALTPFAPLLLGGGQERGLRSGTANVAAAVGFAKALQLAQAELEDETNRLHTLRADLLARLLSLSSRIHLTIEEPGDRVVPQIVSVWVDDLDSETMIMRFDEVGISVSGGSACSTGSLDPSHVLTALGVKRAQALSALRISLGRSTTASDLDAFVAAFGQLLQ